MQPRILHYGALFVFALTACSGGGGSSPSVLPGGATNTSQMPSTTGSVHITEYSIAATSGGPPGDGALLHDGTIWVTVANSLAHVNGTGGKIGFIPIFNPDCAIICDLVGTGLTYHPNNNTLWYGVMHAVGTLSSFEMDWIDATTGSREGGTAPNEGSVSTAVNGADGRVWFTSCGGGVLGDTPFCDALAINTATNATATYDLGSDRFASILATSSHGFLYVFETDRFGASPQIVELSTNGIELHRFNAPDAGLTSMAEGADGNLWMTDNQFNEVIRMTPAGNFTPYAVPTANAGLAGILRATDGNMWFTEPNANNIGRITPGGTITEFPVPTPRSGPLGIFGVDASTCVITPHGSFYITESTNDAIARVDF